MRKKDFNDEFFFLHFTKILYMCNMPWRFRRLSSHYGYLNLAAPVYDVGYMSTILDVLKCICKSCSRILLDEKISKEFLKKMRNPNMEGLRKSELMKSIVKKV
ncbi:hypothetical protein ACOSQ3_005500 [Xanthoceras sorbifolium]